MTVEAHAAGAEREELVPVGFGVLVEQHLLAGYGGVLVEHRRVPVVGTGDRAAAVRSVLLAFEAAAVVPPVAAARRNRHVGFLGPRLDLVEDLLPQRFQMRGGLVGVGVLRFEVGDDLRIGLLTQPLVGGVDEDVVVEHPLGVDPLRDGWVHAPAPIQSPNDSPRNAFVGLDVTGAGGLDDLVRQSRWRRRTVAVPT